jgi:hypothetical protein
MAAFCVGEAAAKLGTHPRNILTLPVERSGGRYTVYGQRGSIKDWVELN